MYEVYTTQNYGDQTASVYVEDTKTGDTVFAKTTYCSTQTSGTSQQRVRMALLDDAAEFCAKSRRYATCEEKSAAFAKLRREWKEIL